MPPVIVMLTALVSGCSTLTPGEPRFNDGRTVGQHLPGKLVWHDLITADPLRAQQFYTDVFGWQFETIEADRYLLARQGGAAVAGIAYHTPRNPAVSETQWITAMSVDNVDSATLAAEARGAEVLEGPVDVAGWGRVALIRDPQGAVLALLRADGGDPPDVQAAAERWVWHELWTRDTAASGAFYSAWGGMRIGPLPGDDYLLMVKDRVPRAGIVELDWDEVEPHWLSYLRVDDIRATLERVRGAGGQVVVGPVAIAGHGTVAVIRDPTGGVLAVQQSTANAGGAS